MKKPYQQIEWHPIKNFYGEPYGWVFGPPEYAYSGKGIGFYFYKVQYRLK